MKPSFLFIPNDSMLFKTLIEGVSHIYSEGKIRITKNGLIIYGMDLSHLVLAYLDLKVSFFSKFEVSENANVGINFADFIKVLKLANADDNFEISFASAEKKLKIKIFGAENKKIRNHSLITIELEEEEMTIDSILENKGENAIKIKTETLIDAWKSAEIYSEIIQLVNKDSKVSFNASGNIGDVEYEISDDLIVDKVKKIGQKNISCAFPIQWLKTFVKKEFSDIVNIDYTGESPMKSLFEFKDGLIFFFLAPRVEEEEKP